MTKKQEKKNDESDIQENLPKTKITFLKNNIVSLLVFLFSISMVFISLISVVFPTLIASNNSIINELRELGITLFEVDSFETGIWAYPLFAANFVVFITVLFHYKKKLPNSITKSFEFLFGFEVSKKVTIIVISILLAIYIGFSIQELTIEEHWEDYPDVKNRVQNWSPDQIVNRFEPHVRYFFIWSSMNLFGNFSILPFIASISLLLLTYFFTYEITKKRFAGIVSLVILLQSNLFLTYDTTVAYTNFWILFYLLSLYLIYKVWPLSPVIYLLSIFSKALTATFFPMSLFFIYRANIPKTTKVIVSSVITALIIGGVLVATSGTNEDGITGKQEDFDWDEFSLGFTSFSFQLRFDGLVLVFILPLIVGLFVASRHGITHADSIMFLIGGILFISPLLTGFTELTNQPYRFVPLVVFFAIGVGILLSKNKN